MVTREWYAKLRHSKMHPHTKFEIPISNNTRDILKIAIRRDDKSPYLKLKDK